MAARLEMTTVACKQHTKHIPFFSLSLFLFLSSCCNFNLAFEAVYLRFFGVCLRLFGVCLFVLVGVFWRMLMWEDGFCRGSIDGEDPVRKAFSKMSIQLYNYGEGWVLGRCLFVMLWFFFSLFFLLYHFFLSGKSCSVYPIPCGGSRELLMQKHGLISFPSSEPCSDWMDSDFGTGWWGKLHLISATSGSLKSPLNVNRISPTIGRVPLMLYVCIFKTSLWFFLFIYFLFL